MFHYLFIRGNKFIDEIFISYVSEIFLWPSPRQCSMGAGDWPSVRWIINNTADRAQFIWPFSPCNWLSFKLGVRAESSHGLDTIWSVRARHQSVATCNYQVPPQSSLTLRGLTTYDRFKMSSESRPLSFSWRCSNRYSRRSSLCCTWDTSPWLSLKSPSVGAGGGSGPL